MVPVCPWLALTSPPPGRGVDGGRRGLAWADQSARPITLAPIAKIGSTPATPSRLLNLTTATPPATPISISVATAVAVASASLSHTSQGQPASQPSVVRQRVVGRRSFASRPPFQPLPTKRLHLAAPFGGRSGVCPLRYCCLRQPLRPPRVRTSLSSSGAQRSSATSCAVLRFLTVGSGARRGVKGLRAGFCLACEAA